MKFGQMSQFHELFDESVSFLQNEHCRCYGNQSPFWAFLRSSHFHKNPKLPVFNEYFHT